ncbi:MAG: gamma-glutamylcyclotransferase [Oligosphaeraceae bacterium]
MGATFARMDQLEGCPCLYRRERVQARLGGETVEAWVYVMNRLPEEAKVIPGGDWREWRRRAF